MNLLTFFIFFILPAVLLGSVFHLLHCLRKKHQLIALAGIICLAMGLFLLILDLVLIAVTHGPQHIPDYLLFNRLVSDSGFAGRWVLTVYVFFSAGLVLSIYLLARNLITKFNKSNMDNK